MLENLFKNSRFLVLIIVAVSALASLALYFASVYSVLHLLGFCGQPARKAG